MHFLLIGFIIGAVAGAAQYWLLSRFAGAVTRGAATQGEATGGATMQGAAARGAAVRGAVFAAVAGVMLPFAVLLAAAFFLRDGLLWAAIGMASSLVTLAVVRFVRTNVKKGEIAKKR